MNVRMRCEAFTLELERRLLRAEGIRHDEAEPVVLARVETRAGTMLIVNPSLLSLVEILSRVQERVLV